MEQRLAIFDLLREVQRFSLERLYARRVRWEHDQLVWGPAE